MQKLVCFALIISGTLFSIIAQDTTDWPSWRGFKNDGFSSSVFNSAKIQADMKPVWQAKIGKGYTLPSILGKDLYIVGNDKNKDTVRAMNAETGAIIWEYSYECSAGDYPGPRASPAIDGTMVYTLSREGQVFAFNRSSGKVLWSRNLQEEAGAGVPGWGISSSAIIEGDLLLINTTKSGVALNKITGKTAWAGKPGTGGYASPVVYTFKGKRYAAIFGETELMAVDVKSGTIAWRQTWRTEYDVNAPDPLVFDNKVFISTGYGRGGALFDFSSGKPVKLWENKNMVSHFSSFIYRNGFIYGIHGEAGSGDNASLRCLNAKTGAVAWEQQIGFGALIAVNDFLLAISERGDLTVAEINSKQFVEHANARIAKGTIWSQPVIAKGLLYLRNDRGDLVCLDVRP
jgi:outer membrane protein assembly factor BamB